MGIKKRWDPEVWLEKTLDLGTLGQRSWNVVKENWHMGFTSFGGPPVHFKIFHDKFVTKLGWIDEQMYQELFSVCQAFSGPGSTKMHYCINLIHSGFLPALLGFLIWSLPGALGMFGLAIGVSNIGESLPRAVYALLSGLNGATVGIIALAAVQLAQKAITDKLTRLLVFLGAAAGLLYNALWYFPLLMFIAGVISVVFDFRWLHPPVKWVVSLFSRKKKSKEVQPEAGGGGGEQVEMPEIQTVSTSTSTRNRNTKSEDQISPAPQPHTNPPSSTEEIEPRTIPPSHILPLTWKSGLLLITLFLLSFISLMITRGLIRPLPLLYSLFSNLYLAGTIIFGGGPVVIPLLRSYTVDSNFLSPRDFLIGLALIQGFPGPNFNFAVYLGALTAINFGHPAALGGLLGYIAIFFPGMITVHGTMGVWGALRGMRWVKSALRGVNAAAVGLIYTAVYRLWQIGWIDEGFTGGESLANDPWWVVVTASSYVGGMWFGVSPPVACLFGAVLGLVRYGVVDA
ncbi:chromate transporter-domain-containing protein [Podospora fimiseda]|uniref:Chromate transporter-domain-containing protein n=1 Tax=Podospora fimiseda TaxID=252190 RepID=A0AAN7BWY6_9PEZI|nr:chromate transporter-domain-containing protein [Podospora fimiseda]